MKSYCERQGQTEIGVVEFEGREFRALGASVQGKRVSGYLGKRDQLQSWCGRTMMDCRSERFGEYRTDCDDDTFGVVYFLTRGRAIVGYCLGVGMLFRGELVEIESREDAIRQCEAECEYWLNIDHDDYERDQAEQMAEIDA